MEITKNLIAYFVVLIFLIFIKVIVLKENNYKAVVVPFLVAGLITL